MTHFADTQAKWDAEMNQLRDQRERVAHLGLSLIVAAAQSTAPDAVSVHLQSSDQGEYLTFSDIETPSGGIDVQGFDSTAEYEAIEDVASYFSWSQADSLTLPGWVVVNRKNGYYRLDIADFLA